MTLDLDALLAPISDDNPAGENLAYDPMYDQIREARRADDPSLPMGVWERELKKADWDVVIRLCLEGLGSRSKDLQLCIWLLEALVNTQGFSGFRQGLELIDKITERFWDDFYPKPEDGSHEHRYGLFRWMARHITDGLKEIPLTAPEDRDTPAYNYHQWERALNAATGRAKGEDTISIVKVNKSLGHTPTEALLALVEHIRAGEELVPKIQARIDASENGEKPTLRPLLDTLVRIREKLMKSLNERGSAPDPEEEKKEDEIVETAPASEAATVARTRRFIASRDDAYVMLDEIADYLMKSEPHSPTPYLIKRIASWGDMSLFDLLREVAPLQDDQFRIQELFFLKKDRPEEED